MFFASSTLRRLLSLLLATVSPLLAQEPAPTPRRLPPRPELSAEAYARVIAELRLAYAKPPAEWPAPQIDAGVSFVEIAPAPAPVYPAENPYAKAKAELGQHLFFDPRLSGSGQIACASCHDPDLAWADGRTTSFGHDRTALKRNSPTLINVSHVPRLFWDGRAASLEAQVIDVILNQEEMRNDAASVAARLMRVPAYPGRFAEAFGTPGITLERVAEAIATFERGLVSRTNKLDTFLRGKSEALNDSALRGLHLFRTDARCANCHHGPTLSDGRFHNENLTYYGREFEDLGRYRVTREAADVGRFKTPTLRNIPRTGPYMHNGLFPHLEGILRAYNAGMGEVRPKPHQVGDPLFPKKSPHLRSLGLNEQDLTDLRAFLETLAETPLRVRPKLPPDAPSQGN